MPDPFVLRRRGVDYAFGTTGGLTYTPQPRPPLRWPAETTRAAPFDGECRTTPTVGA